MSAKTLKALERAAMRWHLATAAYQLGSNRYTWLQIHEMMLMVWNDCARHATSKRKLKGPRMRKREE